MRALLDVNVLIALLDGGHIMHSQAHHWLSRNSKNGFATCPITQNGVIRIMSQPAYPTPRPVTQIAEKIKQLCTSSDHVFWQDSVNMIDEININWQKVLGHRQITDTYLLALAVKNNGRFITFDQRIDTNIVLNAQTTQLEIIV